MRSSRYVCQTSRHGTLLIALGCLRSAMQGDQDGSQRRRGILGQGYAKRISEHPRYTQCPVWTPEYDFDKYGSTTLANDASLPLREKKERTRASEGRIGYCAQPEPSINRVYARCAGGKRTRQVMRREANLYLILIKSRCHESAPVWSRRVELELHNGAIWSHALRWTPGIRNVGEGSSLDLQHLHQPIP